MNWKRFMTLGICAPFSGKVKRFFGPEGSNKWEKLQDYFLSHLVVGEKYVWLINVQSWEWQLGSFC